MADYIDAGKLFQSTHPARGATNQGRQTLQPAAPFQSTHPARGRLCVGAQYCPVRPFQSTHPARGATFTPFLFQVPGNFNPRTPRGCDQGLQQRLWLWLLFQSTHPARGATTSGRAYRALTTKFQSTHPARVRLSSVCYLHIFTPFQSTHPARGATIRTLFIP